MSTLHGGHVEWLVPSLPPGEAIVREDAKDRVDSLLVVYRVE